MPDGVPAKDRKGAHQMIMISAFRWVPDFAQGQVRDLRARWALEEAGLPYRTRLLDQGDQEKAKLRRPGAVEFVQRRLTALSKTLGGKPYLDGDRFTAGDLMMTTVLRILKHTDIVTSDKRLAAYVERCTARPAFKRAFDAQIGDFKEAA